MALTCGLGQHLSAKTPDFVRTRSSYGHLDVSFRRTVRVTDSKDVASWLPPDLGPHDLYPISQLTSDENPSGICFPVHDMEAMILHFRANQPFAVRVYVGGVNAMRLVTDFVGSVTDIDWLEVDGEKDVYLDGFAISEDHALQFVAVPGDSKASFEAQMNGKNANQCISIEVLPLKLFKFDETPFNITVSFLTGRKMEFQVSANTTIAELQRLIQDREGIPPDQMRLLYHGKLISSPYGPRNEWRKLGRFGLKADDKVDMVLRLRGGGRERRAPGAFIINRHMLTVAPGGKIRHRAVLPHSLEQETRYLWDEENTITFKAALLSCRTFQEVTGGLKSIPALDEKAYSRLGLPYFKHPSDLRRQLLSTHEGLITYTALDRGRPLKSLGQMLDLKEGSQCIKDVKTNTTWGTGRSVRISGLDAIYATWKPLGIIVEPPQSPVDWDSSSVKDSGSSSPSGAFIFQQHMSSSQKNMRAHLGDLLNSGLSDSQRTALEEYLEATEDKIGNAIALLHACQWSAKEAIDCFNENKPYSDNSREQVLVAGSSSESSEARITLLSPISPTPFDSTALPGRRKKSLRSLLASLRMKLRLH